MSEVGSALALHEGQGSALPFQQELPLHLSLEILGR